MKKKPFETFCKSIIIIGFLDKKLLFKFALILTEDPGVSNILLYFSFLLKKLIM